MASYGMEIGSHGLNHRYLVTMPAADARQEIRVSKEKLQQLFGLEVCAYAPVGGHYSSWMLGEARAAGYRAFASMVPGRTVIHPNNGIQLIRRNHVQSHHDLSYIGSVIRGDRRIMWNNLLRYHLLAISKRTLGMHTYDHFKNILLRKEVN
jgi:peptidoglycan/xylan/chitin deacetylase (PgdA/CDA1 family)